MLNDLKVMLGITEDDAAIDEKLNLIVSLVTARLKTLLGGIEPPKSMEHIILEVAIIRFNRIGSEGLSDHSMEDEKLTFVDDDFQSFSSEIQAFLNAQEGNARGLRFL